jgi:hypothetical protein
MRRDLYVAFLEDVGRHEEARAQAAMTDQRFRDWIGARPDEVRRVRAYVDFLRAEGRDDEAEAWQSRFHES